VAKHPEGGTTGFLSLGLPVVATTRDPCEWEYGSRPPTDAALYVSIHVGGRTVRGHARGCRCIYTA
jgi:hypothetical protein